MSVYNGRKLNIEIYGESHAPQIGVKVKGFPKFQFDEAELMRFMERRKASSAVYSTKRKEPDQPVFSGAEGGKIKGKFEAVIYNKDTKSGDYDSLYGKPRPSHADYPWHVKDGVLSFAGGGRFSARLTAPLCVIGGICKQYLASLGIEVCAFISEIGGVKGKSYKDGDISLQEVKAIEGFPALDNKEAMLEEITRASTALDSVGGKIECIVYGLKAGLGDNLFGGLEGAISSLIYSIPAVKGVEFGGGFDITRGRGSAINDGLYYGDNGKVCFYSNNAGGINGGISNGNLITMGVAFRPTPSIYKEQKTIDLVNKVNTTIQVKGRHDACIVPRAVPCVESAVAIALTDALL